MAISRVQFKTAHSAAPVFTSNVTAGNLVVVNVAGNYTVGTLTCSDNLGNTYTRDKEAVISISTVTVFHSVLTTGGTCTVSPSNFATKQVTVVEYSGVGAGPTVTSNSATGNANPLQAALTTNSGDLAVANWCDENNNNYSSPVTGFALVQHDSSTFSAQVDDVNTGAGTTNAGINMTSGSASSALAVVNFSPAGGGGSNDGTPHLMGMGVG